MAEAAGRIPAESSSCLCRLPSAEYPFARADSDAFSLGDRGRAHPATYSCGAAAAPSCYATGSGPDDSDALRRAGAASGRPSIFGIREPGRGTLEPDLAAGETGSRTMSLKTIASYYNFYKLQNEGIFYSVRLVKPDKWNILTIIVAGVCHRFRNFCLGCGT